MSISLLQAPQLLVKKQSSECRLETSEKACWVGTCVGPNRTGRTQVMEEIRKNLKGTVTGFSYILNDLMILHCSYYPCRLSIKFPRINTVCFWKSLPVVQMETDLWRLTKANVSGKLIRETEAFRRPCSWSFCTFAFFPLVSLSYTLFVSKKKKVSGANSICKVLWTIRGEFTKQLEVSH